MKILYDIAIACYKWLVALAGRFNTKAKKLSQGQHDVFAKLEKELHPDGGYIWIHASSLGEFEQGRPLIEAIRRHQPQQRILLSFFSPSGYEVRKNYNGVDCVCYLPFDLPRNVNRFLDLVKPRQAIFVKYEFWSNYLNALNERNIPTYIISAIFRPSQIFFKPYGNFFRKMLRCFTHLYVQDQSSKDLLATIGVNNVTVAGDTRFDRVIAINRQAKELPLIEQFAEGKFTWIAGSSWQTDEEILLQYFNAHPEQKLIIAPHEIHETHLLQIEAMLQRSSLRLSQADADNIAHVDCLIIDSFGLLSSIYRYGKFAYIGGGFGAGIHNILEAAVYGIPVIFGPNFKKFREARDLIAVGGACTITQYSDFQQIADRFATSPETLTQTGEKAGSFVSRHAGATDLIYDDLYDTLFGKELK